jgi:hypothetical protein
MLAIDILEWPGMNQAFLVSLILTLALTFVVIPYGKRRPVTKPLSWGEGVAAATYAFAVMFLAYGVVPHQWLTHVQNELGWREDKILYGPGDVFQPKALGGSFPFTINYLQIGDALVAGIYIGFGLLHLWIFAWWQKRGRVKPTTELVTSSYGRPLVRRG